MVIGVGIDLIEVERIERVFSSKKREYFEKIFTPIEIDYSFKMKHPFLHLAARFCAKEAYYKAVGEGILIFKEIEVRNNKNGKPFINLYGKTREKWRVIGEPEIFVSLSHSKNVAGAIVILDKK